MRHLSPHLPNSAVVFTVLAVMNSFRGRSLVLQTGKLPIIQAVFSVAWGEITEDTDSFTQWATASLISGALSYLPPYTPGAMISQGLAHKVA